MCQPRGAERSVKKCQKQKKSLTTQRQRGRGWEGEEDRRQSGERSPPSGNLQTRKRDSMRVRGWQSVCMLWVSGTCLTSCWKAGTHLSSYSVAKNTAGDVGVNPCMGCVFHAPLESKWSVCGWNVTRILVKHKTFWRTNGSYVANFNMRYRACSAVLPKPLNPPIHSSHPPFSSSCSYLSFISIYCSPFPRGLPSFLPSHSSSPSSISIHTLPLLLWFFLFFYLLLLRCRLQQPL